MMVNYVASDGTIRQCAIVEKLSPGAARIQLGKNELALVQHSLKGEPGTFHYVNETIEKKTSTQAPTKAEPTESTQPTKNPERK